ncbi:MAG: hypothetical protein ACXVC6_03260 [Bacteroidia bacterium]
MKKKFYAFLFVAFAGLVVFQLNSCAPKPPKCIITVVDHTGNKPVAGAKVHLYANVTYNNQSHPADLKADGVTDAQGKCSFTFKNPCVMDISATISNCYAVPQMSVYCSGSGIVKFEDGKTNQKTILINQ